MKLLRLRSLIALVLCWLALSTTGYGAIVDWDTLTWTPGALSNSFDVDPSRPGNDVAFVVSGNTNTVTNDTATGLQTPAITMSLAGGNSPVQNALQLSADLHTNSKITLTTTFGNVPGVTNVSFTLFDIDTDVNKEFIKNIYGLAPDGTHIAAVITLGAGVNRTGSGLNQILSGTVDSPDTGVGSDTGNAVISFGTNVITGFAFTWTNNAGAPKYQTISIGDVLFTPVPEIDPGLISGTVCAAAVWVQYRRRARRRRHS